MSIALTLLYAPGINLNVCHKALVAGADVVVLDLEDAVAPRRKNEARDIVADIINKSETNSRVQVRINQFDSAWFFEDIELMKSLPPYVEVRVPKIETAQQISILREHFPKREIHALIETPLGVENAFELARSGVSSLSIGESDLKSYLYLSQDLTSEVGLNWARSRVINAVSAAGLNPPMMSVYTNIKDVQGLYENTKKGRALGFIGRAAIHPQQLEPIRRALAPSREDIVRATKTLESLSQAEQHGSGVIVLPDGSFLDKAMVQAAEMILHISNSLNTDETSSL